MKHFFAILLLIISYRTTCAQTTDALQFDSLLFKLNSAIEAQRDLEIDEIKDVYRLTPWHFMPSLNYDFINNRYYITISASAIVSNMISKRQEVKRVSAATRKYENQSKTAEIRLKSLIISVNQRITNLQLSYHIVTNDISIFQINHTQFLNHEIDTEEFLKLKSSILNKIKNHNSDVAEIQKLLLEISLLTETELFIDLSEFLISPDKILKL